MLGNRGGVILAVVAATLAFGPSTAPVGAVVFMGTDVSAFMDQSTAVAVVGDDGALTVYGSLIFLNDQMPSGASYSGSVELIYYSPSTGCLEALYGVDYYDCPRLGSSAFRACRHATIHTSREPRLRTDFTQGLLLTLDRPEPSDTGVYVIRVNVNGANTSDVFKTSVVVAAVNADGSARSATALQEDDSCTSFFPSSGGDTIYARLAGPEGGDVWRGLDDLTTVGVPTLPPATGGAPTPSENRTDYAPAAGNGTTDAADEEASPERPSSAAKAAHAGLLAVALILLVVAVLLAVFRRRLACRKRQAIYKGDGDSVDSSASAYVAFNPRYLRGVAQRAAVGAYDADQDLMEKLMNKLEKVRARPIGPEATADAPVQAERETAS